MKRVKRTEPEGEPQRDRQPGLPEGRAGARVNSNELLCFRRPAVAATRFGCGIGVPRSLPDELKLRTTLLAPPEAPPGDEVSALPGVSPRLSDKRHLVGWWFKEVMLNGFDC